MQFWNGNKSAVRQQYELAVLQAALDATVAEFGPDAITEDRTDYPLAADESNIFANGADILVTVGGNPKFADRKKIFVPHPIAKGLLGKRLLVVRKENEAAFASIATEAEMKAKSVGIPATWVDAAIFRANAYRVVENGTFAEIFARLSLREFDYVALGAFEIEGIFNALAGPSGELVIENTLMLEYPMPLVFYVHPRGVDLARRVEAGLRAMIAGGELDALFEQQFGPPLKRLALASRRVFHLDNPFSPFAVRDCQS